MANWLPSAARYRVAYTRWNTHTSPALCNSLSFERALSIERRQFSVCRLHNVEASIILAKVACNCLRSGSINSKNSTSKCLVDFAEHTGKFSSRENFSVRNLSLSFSNLKVPTEQTFFSKRSLSEFIFVKQANSQHKAERWWRVKHRNTASEGGNALRGTLFAF